jgi:hypothetical protein
MENQPSQQQPSRETAKGDQTITVGTGPGAGTVNTAGIILISVYVVLLTLFAVYILIKIWPHCIGAPSVTQTQTTVATQPTDPKPASPDTAASTTTTSIEAQCKNPEWIEFFWGRGYWVWEEVRLLLIVIIAGVLGALLHVIRSVFWYVGHRAFRASWVLMYLLLPFTGALLAIAFYLVIRGGFFPQAKADESNPIGFAALAFLMGLFSAQAGLKLKQVFETIFSPAPQGANAKPEVPTAPAPGSPSPAPTVSAISPTTGKTGGGETVTISGENFADGLAVLFGEAAAVAVTFISSTTITAVTPAHAAGSVDIVVTNKDNQIGKLLNGFTFEG